MARTEPPTMSDVTPLLHSELVPVGPGSSDAESVGAESADVATSKNALGTFAGVFLPCILSIFGAILFLRLPWAIGEAGVVGVLLMFALAGMTVLLTVLSIAAISTNGTMKGGGAYYMISRALGPEFGGAVGLVFFAANSVGITFYMIAYAGEVNQLMGGTDDDVWQIRLYASVTLLFLLCVSMVGAGAFAKFNTIVFACLMVSVAMAAVSFFIPSGTPGHTGISAKTLEGNTMWHYGVDSGSGKELDFFAVLIVVFPAMTGVMAGANMSGDLADAGKSIGTGTLQAIFFALAVYATLIVVIGATVTGEELRDNLFVMQNVCVSPVFVAMGIVASTLSSALGNLVGSGRVLQALARDNLFPFLKPFGWGSKKGDEPRPAILLAWLIAQAAVFAGNLNAVAAIISGFFLLVYFFTNLACFVLRITGAPNFRPGFRYFTWHTALAGALLCGFILFISQPVYASLAIIVLVIAWLYVHYTAPVTEWGDVTQALLFHQVRKYLLRIDERKQHVKFWRPSVLLLVQDPSTTRGANLVDFCNNLKKGGIYVLGSIVTVPDGDIGRVSRTLGALRTQWLHFIEAAHLKAFTETAVGPTPRIAYQNLMLTSGVGGMKPNTVVIPFVEVESEHDSPFSRALSLGMYGEGEELLDDDAATGKARFGLFGASKAARDTTGVHSDAAKAAGESIHRFVSSRDMKVDESVRAAAVESAIESAGGGGDDDGSASGDVAAEFPSGTRASGPIHRKSGFDSSGVLVRDVMEWTRICNDALTLGKHLVVTRNFAQLDKDLIVGYARKSRKTKIATEAARMRIDIWAAFDPRDADDGALSLQLQLAHVLHRTDIWSESTALRLVAAVLDQSEMVETRRRLQSVLRRFRFQAELRVLPILGGRARPVAAELYPKHKAGELDLRREPDVLNELVRHNSEHSAVLFMPLPALPAREEEALRYHSRIDRLTRGLPPTVLVTPAKDQTVLTDAI